MEVNSIIPIMKSSTCLIIIGINFKVAIPKPVNIKGTRLEFPLKTVNLPIFVLFSPRCTVGPNSPDLVANRARVGAPNPVSRYRVWPESWAFHLVGTTNFLCIADSWRSSQLMKGGWIVFFLYTKIRIPGWFFVEKFSRVENKRAKFMLGWTVILAVLDRVWSWWLQSWQWRFNTRHSQRHRIKFGNSGRFQV